MAKSLIWLPEVLQNAGLKVSLVDGWEDRGHGDVGSVVGVICHHTAGSPTGNMPTLDVLINGRADLPGPLSQLGLGRDGTFYVVAAGRCYHAGKGVWQEITSGNSRFIGIEAENTGSSHADPWPLVQMDAYRRGVAAILKHIGKGAEFCAGHKEYAKPVGRKSDPNFDMDSFRAEVAGLLRGIAPRPILIPAMEPSPGPTGRPPRLTLRRGMKDSMVRELQEKLRISIDGDFGPKTEGAVREFQRQLGLVPDGIVGPKTWLALDGAQL